LSQRFINEISGQQDFIPLMIRMYPLQPISISLERVTTKRDKGFTDIIEAIYLK